MQVGPLPVASKSAALIWIPHVCSTKAASPPPTAPSCDSSSTVALSVGGQGFDFCMQDILLHAGHFVACRTLCHGCKFMCKDANQTFVDFIPATFIGCSLSGSFCCVFVSFSPSMARLSQTSSSSPVSHDFVFYTEATAAIIWKRFYLQSGPTQRRQLQSSGKDFTFSPDHSAQFEKNAPLSRCVNSSLTLARLVNTQRIRHVTNCGNALGEFSDKVLNKLDVGTVAGRSFIGQG